MSKKIVSFITSLSVMFSLLSFLPNKLLINIIASAYNASAAVSYANTYWSNYNPNYSNYNSIGGDCANFVSQCLVAGGMQMTDGWYWYSYDDRSASWSACASMYNYFKNSGYEIIENPSDSQVIEGNPVLYYSSSKGRWSHAAICTGHDSSGNALVSAHNSDRHNVNWKLGTNWSKRCTIIINGNGPNTDIVTPTISTDKSSYIVGDTIYTSWVASPSNSNISHYWINVIAPDGTWIHEGNMNLSTSYSFSASQEGEYTVRVYATPKGSKDGEGSLSDERKISVASATWYGSLTPVNLGETFDSVLLAKDPWITIRALGAEEDYNVILQSEQGVTSEMWRFTRQDDGSYVITNFATGRVLDAYGLGTTDFTNVFTDVYNGGGNQKWFIYEKNGGYVLRPAYSDMVLDVDHAIFESGTNIEIHTQNDSTAQNFALYYENASYGTPKTGNIIAKADGCSVTLNIDKGFYIDQQNIYRSTDKENWLLINSGTNEDNLTAIDVGLNENMTYYYKVTYSNRYYNIESDIVSVTTGHKSIIGDCNNDGVFTIADIVMLQKWLLNDGTVLANWKAADLYEDNMLNVFDLALMKQLVLE